MHPFLLFVCLTIPACTPARDYPGEQSENKEAVLPDGLRCIELKPGDGAEAKEGMMVSVHYTGYLMDGKKFDSSHDRNGPLVFIVGGGGVIAGLSEGVVGMKVNQKRKLIVPPHLGYEDRGFPGLIPPGAELVFDIELVEARELGQ